MPPDALDIRSTVRRSFHLVQPQRCVDFMRQIRRAELRGWHLAAAELSNDLRYTITSVQTELAAVLRELPATTITKTMTKTSDICADLVALGEEFEELNYDLRGRWLSVTTESIELNGIYLGPFEIRLDWGRALGRNDPAYRVIATDPHPAECRDNVTHPHVCDELLCEGHSRQAIRQALVQGRLLDFFTLVASGLRTYNEESPFVALEIWSGKTCSDCGAVVDEDESYVCQQCNESTCAGCEAACCGCDNSCCSSCITSCEACDDNYCGSCLQPCHQCRIHVCPGCLEEDERCTNCHEEDRDDENESTDAAPDCATVQPHGLVQAVVPA